MKRGRIVGGLARWCYRRTTGRKVLYRTVMIAASLSTFVTTLLTRTQ